MESDFFKLCAIALAILLGAMSPGASFLLSTRVALSASFSASFGVAIGLGGGAMIFALLALSGLHSLLNVIPQLHGILKVMGGCYLIWCAVKILFTDSRAPIHSQTTPPLTFIQALITGLFTQLSNPNTAIVFASLFTTLLDNHLSTTIYITVPVMTFFIDFLWFTFVALLLSQSLPRQIYLRAKVIIDRITAGILGLLGLKLFFE